MYIYVHFLSVEWIKTLKVMKYCEFLNTKSFAKRAFFGVHCCSRRFRYGNHYPYKIPFFELNFWICKSIARKMAFRMKKRLTYLNPLERQCIHVFRLHVDFPIFPFLIGKICYTEGIGLNFDDDGHGYHDENVE